MSITLILIIVTGLISWRALEDRSMIEQLKHYPYKEVREKEWHRMLTSGFVHGSMMHLALNMYVFYIFGEYVESNFVMRMGPTTGRILYVVFYLSAIVFADIPTFLRHKDNPSFASVGASGAVSGILFIFILIQPWSTLLLFFIIPMPAIIAGVGYLIYSSWASKKGTDNIDHLAHFYGAVYGVIFFIAFQPSIINEFLTKLLAGPSWSF